MINLLNETMTCIRESGHTVKDIIFIGSEDSGYACSWGEFTVLANEEYNNIDGSAIVARDLIIVFSDGKKMWRNEHDGIEWWEFSTPFKKPQNLLPITSLFAQPDPCVDLTKIHSRY